MPNRSERIPQIISNDPNQKGLNVEPFIYWLNLYNISPIDLYKGINKALRKINEDSHEHTDIQELKESQEALHIMQRIFEDMA